MSIYDKPPGGIVIYGREYAVNTDFRVWIEISRLLSGGGRRLEKLTRAIMLCYCNLPPDAEKAVTGMIDFYRAGQPKTGKGGGSDKKRIYDFYLDAEYIYAAFMSEYGIDLSETSMHWHKFKALFSALGEGNLFVKIMQYRSMDLSKIKDREQKNFYSKMKRVYSLPDMRTDAEKLRDMDRELEGFF